MLTTGFSALETPGDRRITEESEHGENEKYQV